MTEMVRETNIDHLVKRYAAALVMVYRNVAYVACDATNQFASMHDRLDVMLFVDDVVSRQ